MEPFLSGFRSFTLPGPQPFVSRVDAFPVWRQGGWLLKLPSRPNPFPMQPGKQKLNKGLIETKSMQICICLQESESRWYQQGDQLKLSMIVASPVICPDPALPLHCELPPQLIKSFSRLPQTLLFQWPCFEHPRCGLFLALHVPWKLCC